jgi:hypothetical protein
LAFADPLVLAYDGANYNLNRQAPVNNSTVYFGYGTNMTFTVTVKHNIPAVGKDGEAHLFRIDVDYTDATTGLWKHRTSAWCNIRTDGTPQDVENAEDVAEALVDFLIDGNVTKLVSRQS